MSNAGVARPCVGEVGGSEDRDCGGTTRTNQMGFYHSKRIAGLVQGSSLRTEIRMCRGIDSFSRSRLDSGILACKKLGASEPLAKYVVSKLRFLRSQTVRQIRQSDHSGGAAAIPPTSRVFTVLCSVRNVPSPIVDERDLKNVAWL